jgi:hypothetical protein
MSVFNESSYELLITYFEKLLVQKRAIDGVYYALAVIDFLSSISCAKRFFLIVKHRLLYVLCSAEDSVLVHPELAKMSWWNGFDHDVWAQ